MRIGKLDRIWVEMKEKWPRNCPKKLGITYHRN